MKAVLMLIALVLLALAAVIGVQRASFVSAAVPAIGKVVDIEARDSRCGRKPRRQCTKFTAIVEYVYADETRRLNIGAGQERGRGEPISEADRRIGDPVALRVHPQTREALPDGVAGLWGLPLILGISGLVFGVVGTIAGRRR